MENRLAELESRLAFQERMLQELNDVVTSQEQRISALQEELHTLRAQLRALIPAPLANEDEETPPPHY